MYLMSIFTAVVTVLCRPSAHVWYYVDVSHQPTDWKWSVQEVGYCLHGWILRVYSSFSFFLLLTWLRIVSYFSLNKCFITLSLIVAFPFWPWWSLMVGMFWWIFCYRTANVLLRWMWCFCYMLAVHSLFTSPHCSLVCLSVMPWLHVK